MWLGEKHKFLYGKKKTRQILLRSCTQQRNGYDCGPFVGLFAKQVILRASEGKPFNPYSTVTFTCTSFALLCASTVTLRSTLSVNHVSLGVFITTEQYSLSGNVVSWGLEREDEDWSFCRLVLQQQQQLQPRSRSETGISTVLTRGALTVPFKRWLRSCIAKTTF